MDNELKQDFTRRLSQCNKGEMIVIIYDIYFAYTKEAKEFYKGKEHEEFKNSIKKAQNTLDELMYSLDFKYPLAKSLKELYVYCKMELSKALYENKLDRVDSANHIMEKLYDGFKEAAKEDKSAPLMCNAHKVVAGMTYGRNDLTENCLNDTNRGFWA